MPRLSPISLSLITVMCATACAAASSERQPELDRTFAQIQLHEAAIEHSRALVARTHSACGERCAAAQSAADHERQLCELARAAADADALERCDRALRTSTAIDSGTRARCGCQIEGTRRGFAAARGRD